VFCAAFGEFITNARGRTSDNCKRSCRFGHSCLLYENNCSEPNG
jgi:hypothetical protein